MNARKRGSSPYSQNSTLTTRRSTCGHLTPSDCRPYHARPTHQLSVSPATQRPTSPNSASGGHEKPLPGTARALPRKVENRKKVQTPPSSWRAAGVSLWCVLLYCRCGLVGTCCFTAVVLLWWSVGRWVGGGCLVGGGSLAIHEMAGSRKTTNLPRFLPCCGSSRLRNQVLLAYRCTVGHTAALPYCCSGLVGGW